MGDNGLEKYHEIGVDFPEECLIDLSDEIPCIFHYVFTLYTNWKAVRSQLSSEDFIRAYQWHKKILQLLSFQTGDLQNEQRWVLKCPLHVFLIPELKQVFPDAKLVWAHRHPAPTVSSLCSLMKTIRGLYIENGSLDVKDFGQRIFNASMEAVQHAPKDIAESGLPCAHVLFEKLTADPIGAVKGIYEQFGMEFTPDYEEILQVYLEENRLKREATIVKLSAAGGETKKVLHEHKPEDFGLVTKSLSEGVFGDYIKAFGITSSK